MIQRSETKLPCFQHFEAWDRNRICRLIETVICNLPLGITLILNVGDKEKFVSRYLARAPELDTRVHEHLLDGQQRLTRTSNGRKINDGIEKSIKNQHLIVMLLLGYPVFQKK